MKETTIMLVDQHDIVKARQTGRELAKTLGFGAADQTRLATAISEITRNALQCAGKGQCSVTGVEDTYERRIHVVVEDHGPGIPDIKKAMEDGYSTGSGLGAGLPGAKRLMHEFYIESRPGFTRVTMSMARKIM